MTCMEKAAISIGSAKHSKRQGCLKPKNKV